jgi:nucleotide-binding universal stress UspA family protein
MVGTVHGIVAGYDGSSGSEEALNWAAWEAGARETVLTVCHVWSRGGQATTSHAAAFDLARRSGERTLAQGLAYARAVKGSLDVRPLLAAGTVAQVLCERSADAELMVAGSRGGGGLDGLLLGSVSLELAMFACGPVVVVRGRWRSASDYARGPVVVGVDGSEASRAAVAFAAAEAALRDVPLQAVCALADSPGTLGGAHLVEEDFDQVMARCEKEHPEVPVRRQVTDGSARAALLAAAYNAQLLVVGSRGRGGVRGMKLGSVSQAVLHYAPCTVSVVRSQ